MKNIFLIPALVATVFLASCGHYAENVEKGKKAKCKLEELDKQLAADPSKEGELRIQINQNLDWIKFYREESGDAAKYDEELAPTPVVNRFI